jgi:putative chitinase
MSDFSFEFSVEKLEDILTGNKQVEEYYNALCKALPKYDITNERRVAGFLAQCAHESNNFKVLKENLNYSADGLKRIFPKYFKDVDPNDYARQPEKIANRVYANRMNNGDEDSGDGWKYRGRGVIQLTGCDNYSRFAKDMDISLEEVVEYLETIEGAIMSAAWYWNSRKINTAADNNDIVKMTKLVNGGTIGLEDRKKHYAHILEVLGTEYEESSDVEDTEEEESDAEAININQVIKRGAKGPTVVALQEALGVGADGAFGGGTEKALKAWQEANGLTADGIAGPKTLQKLLG